MNNEIGFCQAKSISASLGPLTQARHPLNDPAMGIIIETVSALEFCGRIGSDRLGILPLRTARSGGRDYVTLTEAISTGHARVTEISNNGRVNELSVINDGNCAVLALDGEELIGAKQNRIVNLSILVPPRTSLNIPVSCVESGRWARWSHELVPSGRAHPFYGRRMKLRHVSASLRARRSRYADQIAIWTEIDERLHTMRVRASTGATSAIYLQRRDELDTLTRGVVAEDRDTGAFFLNYDGILGLELCDSPEIWRRVLPHLLASYGLDVLDGGLPEFGSELDTAPARFLTRVRDARLKRYPSIGLGEDLRFEGHSICGAALMWRDRLVHLVGFNLRLKRGRQSRFNQWQHLFGLASSGDVSGRGESIPYLHSVSHFRPRREVPVAQPSVS